MTLENYRRFNEKTTINFARGDNNVTVIRAENGAGKTGILMALLFGLFGTVKYEQFQIQEDKDFMVGAHLLENGRSAECTVTVVFVEDDKKYQIVRSIQAANINGHIQQANNDVKAFLFRDGIKLDWKKEQIDRFMNSIIGENIRGFLFFDGVKYTDLFKQNDRKTKQELQKIIEKMLNIDDLNSTISYLNSLAAGLGSKGASKFATDLANKKNELKAIEESIQKQKDAEDENRKAYAEYKRQYEKILNDAKDFEQYKDVVEEINATKSKIEIKQASLNEAFNTLAQSAQNYLLNGIYNSFGNESKETFDKLAADTRNAADIIRIVLDTGECICGCHSLSQEQRQHLQNQLEEYKKGSSVSFELSTRARCDSYVIEHVSKDDSFEDNLDKISCLIDEIDELDSKRMDLESQIKDGVTAEELSREIEESNKQQGSFDATMKAKQRAADEASIQIGIYENQKKKLEEKIESLNEEAALESGTKRQYDFYKGTQKKLEELKERYMKNAKEEISKRANEFFLQLLSPDDRKLFESLKLDEDYSIKVYNFSGQEIFGQMSAGQKLLASMAFVMGLTATASNAKPTCNFPLVMDTPFSNLDLRNRESLIGLMPTVVKQWILTPIDTELTQSEIGFFDKGGKVGKAYYLKKDGQFTSLVEYPSILKLNFVGGNR